MTRVLETGGYAAAVGLLHLEHYPGMTEKELANILEEAEERWPLIGATVIHRVGDLYPSDDIVFVGTASEHRADAFSSCEFIMDYLKTKATFWKKEKTTFSRVVSDVRDTCSRD